MNLTDKGKFQTGNKVAKGKSGKKHQSTLIKYKLSECINDVDSRLYEITFELLNSKNQKIRALAWKELLKYRLPKNHVYEVYDKEQLRKDLENIFE